MKILILDTNFLMLPYTENLDVFEELNRLVVDENSLATLSGVVDELKKIIDNRESKGRDKTAARIALQLIEKKEVKVIESHGRVDDQIIDYARKNRDTIVCTNDKKLKKKLAEIDIPVAYIRDRSRLGLSNP